MSRRTPSGRSRTTRPEGLAGCGPHRNSTTYVPFVRGRQFAAVAAITATRVDLGLRLPDPPNSPRLQPATAPGRPTHKVTLNSADDVDDDVRSLLRTAYEQTGA